MSTEIEWTDADMREFEADFELAVDMFEHAMAEKDRDLPDTD